MGTKQTIREKIQVPCSFTVSAREVSLEERKKLGVKEALRIEGLGILPTVSRNGIKYVFEEISQNWKTIEGETITVNHTQDVTDAVAIIEDAPVNQEGQGRYEAIVYNTNYHPEAISMVRKGLFKYVSIEADAELEYDESDDTFIARNMEFTGLAFVRTPGIKETSVAVAEAFEGAFKKHKKKVRKKMSEKDNPEAGAAPEPQPEAGAEPKPEPKPEGEGSEPKPAGEGADPAPEPAKPEGAAEASTAKILEAVQALTKKVNAMEEAKEEKIAEAVKKVLETKGAAMHKKPLAESEKRKVLEDVDIQKMTVTDILNLRGE